MTDFEAVDRERWRKRREIDAKAAKPLAGHKGHEVFGCHYTCECGWSGTDWYGKGAQTGAAADFHRHKVTCLLAEGTKK